MSPSAGEAMVGAKAVLISLIKDFGNPSTTSLQAKKLYSLGLNFEDLSMLYRETGAGDVFQKNCSEGQGHQQQVSVGETREGAQFLPLDVHSDAVFSTPTLLSDIELSICSLFFLHRLFSEPRHKRGSTYFVFLVVL